MDRDRTDPNHELNELDATLTEALEAHLGIPLDRRRRGTSVRICPDTLQEAASREKAAGPRRPCIRMDLRRRHPREAAIGLFLIPEDAERLAAALLEATRRARIWAETGCLPSRS